MPLIRDYDLIQAINVVNSEYSDAVSVLSKKKNLLKFGRRTTVGTGWEALATAQGTETEETLLSSNGITHVVSGASGDNGKTLKLEYHTISSGVLTFGVQDVTLDASDATTPVALTTACGRANRSYNTSTSGLTGPIYYYEGGTRTDANTHLVIPAGENQTQKAQTAISDNDYWFISSISVTCLAKTTKYVEARLEAKPTTQSYWRPVSQTFAVTDTTGTVAFPVKPYIIVPSNYDVRLAVRTNTSSVDVAGGFSGYLAIVT